MTLEQCCPNCENPQITAPRGERVQWYCPSCLQMFDQPAECEVKKIRKPRKAKISPEQQKIQETRKKMQDIRRRKLLRGIQAACKRARGQVRAFEPVFHERKYWRI